MAGSKNGQKSSTILGQPPILMTYLLEVMNVEKTPIKTRAFKMVELMISIGLMLNGISSGLDICSVTYLHEDNTSGFQYSYLLLLYSVLYIYVV